MTKASQQQTSDVNFAPMLLNSDSVQVYHHERPEG